jgi:hypothetical protein
MSEVWRIKLGACCSALVACMMLVALELRATEPWMAVGVGAIIHIMIGCWLMGAKGDDGRYKHFTIFCFEGCKSSRMIYLLVYAPVMLSWAGGGVYLLMSAERHTWWWNIVGFVGLVGWTIINGAGRLDFATLVRMTVGEEAWIGRYRVIIGTSDTTWELVSQLVVAMLRRPLDQVESGLMGKIE